jgi:hypothetical protein
MDNTDALSTFMGMKRFALRMVYLHQLNRLQFSLSEVWFNACGKCSFKRLMTFRKTPMH